MFGSPDEFAAFLPRQEASHFLDEGVPHLPRGGMVDKYFIISLLGAGNMGEVYTAYDPDLDRSVALKLLRTARDSNSSVTLLAAMSSTRPTLPRMSGRTNIAIGRTAGS